MKAQLWELLRRSPQLQKRDFILFLLPFLLWAGGFYSRGSLIYPRCAIDPNSCTKANIFLVDQLTLGMQNSRADQLSFVTQNWSGYIAAATPPIISTALVVAGKISPVNALILMAVDMVILLESVAWNGTVTEAARLIVQRPRPFVYNDPKGMGVNPAHYTSFFSGHTSFAAVTGLFLVFTLIGRGASRRWIVGSSIYASCMIILTGIFRVMAGRHFITDVLAAALAGSAVAFTIAKIHRKNGLRKS